MLVNVLSEMHAGRAVPGRNRGRLMHLFFALTEAVPGAIVGEAGR